MQTVHLLRVSMHRGQRLPACILQNATPSCTLLLQYLACQTYHIGLHQVVLVWRLCVGMCCPTHGYVSLYENDDRDLLLVPLLTEYTGKPPVPRYVHVQSFLICQADSGTSVRSRDQTHPGAA